MKTQFKITWLSVALLLSGSSCLVQEKQADPTPQQIVNGFAGSVSGANTLSDVAQREQEEQLIIQWADEGQ